MTWHEETIEKTRMFLENMVAEGLLARRIGMDVTPAQVVDGTLRQIVDIAEHSFPLARLMDASDIVFHAEGPGAEEGRPWLSAVTWMVETVNSNLRRLSATLFDLRGAAGAKLARQLDLRTTGVLPGSIWMGVKIEVPPADLLPADAELLSALARDMSSLPTLIRFIDDEAMRPGIEEAVPDPALLDAQLFALFHLAPTGQRGIHTLEISAKEAGSASLSQRERVVLREAVKRPSRRDARSGSFVGQVREADLDKNRLHLREVKDVGTLRCVLNDLPASTAKELLGSLARAEGDYVTDKSGRPRLLFVKSIQQIGQESLLPSPA